MELELEERGNIHTDTIWFEIVDSQAPPSDEGNTIAKIEGLTETHLRLGNLFASAPELLLACQKQQVALEELLVICPLKKADIPSLEVIINDARDFAAKAIAKTSRDVWKA